MSRLRLVVHLGLDRNNEVKCHLVQMCGRLIPFWRSFKFKEEYLRTSFWRSTSWGVCNNLKGWKEWAKEVHRVVRFQRVTYTVDSIKKGVR